MSLFKKRTDPVADFWTWWAAVRWRAEKSLTDPEVIAGMNRRVSAIDKGLHWEFAPGRTSRSLLIVSSYGDARLRPIAERWRQAGPPSDQIFGYATARQGDPAALNGPLTIGGHEIDLAAMLFAAEPDPRSALVHVRVWHPAFARLPKLVRSQVKYLALDWLLGEDVVEIWVGRIETVLTPGLAPDGPAPGAPPPDDNWLTGPELAALVQERIPPDGKFRWRNLNGIFDGKLLFAAAQTPLRAATHPGYGIHIRIVVPYADRRDNGLPTKPALAELYALEDHIYQRADGAVLVAHEMTDGIWTSHLYAERPAAAEALKPAVSAWPHGRAEVTATLDPKWQRVAHLAN